MSYPETSYKTNVQARCLHANGQDSSSVAHPLPSARTLFIIIIIMINIVIMIIIIISIISITMIIVSSSVCVYIYVYSVCRFTASGLVLFVRMSPRGAREVAFITTWCASNTSISINTDINTY